MLICHFRRWYDVMDPAEAGHRVEATIGHPTHPLCHRARHEVKPIFAQWPIQTDYSDPQPETKALYKRTLKRSPCRTTEIFIRASIDMANLQKGSSSTIVESVLIPAFG